MWQLSSPARRWDGLTAEEKSELDHYFQLEHIMRLAKARAQQYLPSKLQ